MSPDLKELLQSFNAHSVKYLVVDGYAVSFHAQPRATKGLDIFIKPDPENAKAALCGARVIWNPRKFIRFGREPIAVDILPGIDGVSFDEAWERRIEGVIDLDTGQRAFFISRPDLIASKIAAGRMRDLADVEEIREAEAKTAQKK